jgi:hypothetical protein
MMIIVIIDTIKGDSDKTAESDSDKSLNSNSSDTLPI